MRVQGESYYEGARQELSSASNEASKGFTDLISHTNSLSIAPTSQDRAAEATEKQDKGTEPPVKVPESLPADIVKEAESILSRFRNEAAARLKQVQKAEDAADQALEKFGGSLRDYLRDAVTITAPTDDKDGSVKSVLFESKDAEGKRVVHATRFDAQLHVIHSASTSFTQDPPSEEYSKWKHEFEVEKKTDAIVGDLNRYPDLRRAMETLVPEKVEYPEFWRRYYFLRHVIETEEQKRRELLNQTQAEDEEVSWEDDDEDENQKATTPRQTPEGTAETKQAEVAKDAASADLLKPREPRRSNENSVADSDASYDIVSGQTSRSPGSPKEEREDGKKKAALTADQSDEEDWE